MMRAIFILDNEIAPVEGAETRFTFKKLQSDGGPAYVVELLHFTTLSAAEASVPHHYLAIDRSDMRDNVVRVYLRTGND